MDIDSEWDPDIRHTEGPIYLALAGAIERDIQAGKLDTGARLPTQRELAGRLGVDVTTVTRAYAHAAQLGLIESEGRRGSFVKGRAVKARAAVAESAPEDVGQLESIGMVMPPEPADGSIAEAIRTGLAQILSAGGPLPIHYQPTGGMEAARRGAAERLSDFLPTTNPDQIVLTAGGQNALHAICSTVIGQGGLVAAGSYTYPGFLTLARRLNAHVTPLACDAGGILPDALATLARKRSLRALYVVPTNDNPTTATLDEKRLRAIAELATRHGFAIIEDDAYGYLAKDKLAPIARYAPERTWYISSLSKAVSPFLRIAAVRAPTVRDALDLAADVQETAIMPPPLSNALAALWWRNGTLGALVAGVRAESIARQKLAREILGADRFAAHPDGFHLWLSLPDGTSGADLMAGAMLSGLPVVPASTFAVKPTGLEQSLRVSLGGSRSRERIARDLGRLDALLARLGRRGVSAG